MSCKCARILSDASSLISNESCSIPCINQSLNIVKRTVWRNFKFLVEFLQFRFCVPRRGNALENALLVQLTLLFLSVERKIRFFMHETDRYDQGVHTKTFWNDSDENGKTNHRHFCFMHIFQGIKTGFSRWRTRRSTAQQKHCQLDTKSTIPQQGSLCNDQGLLCARYGPDSIRCAS